MLKQTNTEHYTWVQVQANYNISGEILGDQEAEPTSLPDSIRGENAESNAIW